MVAIEPSDDDFPKLKHAYGFVPSVTEAPPSDTAAPFQLNVVVKLPAKYSAAHLEKQFSWARVAAYASKSDFDF